MQTAILKEPLGWLYNGAALGYALTAYVVGFVGLFSGNIVVNLGATLLLGHGMVIAAYLIHECGHQLIFRRNANNACLGRVLSWLCGSAYGTYEDMRYKHFRHHVDNDDVVWFLHEEFLAQRPSLLRLVRILEWFYIPAHDLIMHFIMVFTSFIIPQRRDQRLRNVVVIIVRGTLFALLLIFAPRVAMFYAIAYMLMMHVLRFMDSLQHDYPYHPTLFDYAEPEHKGDAEWEQAHTFSVPVSMRYPRLNWLTLNFGYHNAHHFDMHVPWYRLPALHKQLTGNDPAQVIPLVSQLKLYHRNRVSRVCNPQSADYPQAEEFLRNARAATGSIGGNGASFLTSF